jgi:hypothetical protein
MTIQQTIEIPADRHLRLDLTLPESFPAGQGEIILRDSAATKAQKMRESMPTIAELKKEARERAERERVTGDTSFSSLKGCMKDSPCFASRTGEEIQRELREEWN